MSEKLSAEIRKTGTRFRIFPQSRYIKAFSKPETIVISVSPDKIHPGPADDRMYVKDPVKKRPYSPSDRPPYSGPNNPPVKANKKGHFDHLKPGSREFLCASMYATVRFVLDIWEDYFNHRIEWHFDMDFERLELIPLIEWTNAQAGYGFMEFGYANYDALSVMHYPQCNGGGDFSLTLTYLDKNGAACIYDPAPGFSVDPNICPDLAPTPGPQPKSCGLLSKSFPQQQINQNQVKQYGPYIIQPGSRFVVFMLANDSTGDPDLYVRFQNKPTTSNYACRPYISGANETCDLDVPLGQNKAYVMVRGYRNGKYHIVVTGISETP